MANSDYTARGLALPLCPLGILDEAIGYLDDAAILSVFVSPSAAPIRAGSAAFVGEEIVSIDGFEDGPKIQINYTYSVTTVTVTGTAVHTEETEGGFLRPAGYEFELTAPSDSQFDYAIDAKYETNPEIPSYNTLVYGSDYIVSDWTFTLLKPVNTFGAPIVIRVQYKQISTSVDGTTTTLSVAGGNVGTNVVLPIGSGVFDTVNYVRYTEPFGGPNVPLVEDTDYSLAANVLTFLVDYRELSSRKYMQISRGCCDTVPAEHDEGTQVWFFDDYLARDDTEYAPTETIGVKPLPTTAAGVPVPVEFAPPAEITFNWRFARPYPPGQVEVNGDPWFTPKTITGTPLTITWAHRNRVTQADVLVDHTQSSVTPEVDTTYTARIFDESDILQATYAGIAGASFEYTLASAIADFAGAAPGITHGYVLLTAVRDSLESWQAYRIDFDFTMV